MLQRRPLGRSGLEVSVMGFGAWPIGGSGYGRVHREVAVTTVEAYLDLGGNFIDTARAYGDSEGILGEVLHRHAGKRSALVLATKTKAGETAESLGAIETDLDESLRLLRTEYVDLLYLHQPPEDPEVMARALDELDRLKAKGKIRAVGASIKGLNVTDQTEKLCRDYIDSGRVGVLQVVYSILRQKLLPVIRTAASAGVGIVARTTLESGLLSGRYRAGVRFGNEDHRSRYPQERLESILSRVAEIESLAVKPPYGSLREVALRFSLEPQAVGAIIVGARTPEAVRDNLAILDLPPLEGQLVESLKQRYGALTAEANAV